MKNKKTIFGLLIGIVFLLVLSVSYAYFSTILDIDGDSRNIIAETGSLKLTYTDGQQIIGTNIQPGWTQTKTIAIENTGSLQAYYSINWIDILNEITNEELVVSASCVRTVNAVETGTCEPIEETVVQNVEGSIVDDIPIEADVKHTYSFAVSFKEMNSVQNYNQGKNFHGTIVVNEFFHWYQECNENPDNINCLMISSTTPYSENVNSTYVTGEYYDIVLWNFFEGGRAPLTDYSSGSYYHDNYGDSNYTTAIINAYVGDGTWDAGEGACFFGDDYVVDGDGMVVETQADCGAVYKNTWDEYLHKDLVLMNDLDTHIVSSGDGIDFDRMSGDTNGKGLYYTENASKSNNGGRIYYYRGSVDNNYVKVDNNCYRIIRTNEDGSIRLFYWGPAVGNACSTESSTTGVGSTKYYNTPFDNAKIGFMYGTSGSSSYELTHANTNDSLVKDVLDEWYSTNILENSSNQYIVNTIYCNDRSIGTSGTVDGNTFNSNGFGTSPTAYGSYRRVMTNGPMGTTEGPNNSSPTFACPQDNDKFTLKVDNNGAAGYGNNKLTYPVGLVTVDEIVHAGSVVRTQGSGKYHYLITGAPYWTMSPLYTTSNAGWFAVLNSVGNIVPFNGTFNSDTTVVPVISIKGDIDSEGNGTASEPYYINIQ